MKNMFDKNVVTALKSRVESLNPNSEAQWGSFDVHGMVCHLIDALGYALGDLEEVKDLEKGPPMFIRSLVRLYIPIPKARIQTSPVMLTTSPDEWEKDKVRLLNLMDRFLAERNREKWPMHSFFGHIGGLGWAKITVRHINHHLKQFGV